jgi:hypothetical protein
MLRVPGGGGQEREPQSCGSSSATHNALFCQLITVCQRGERASIHHGPQHGSTPCLIYGVWQQEQAAASMSCLLHGQGNR